MTTLGASNLDEADSALSGGEEDSGLFIFLSKVGVNEDDYLWYISVIHKTRTLVLKRNVRERYINKEICLSFVKEANDKETYINNCKRGSCIKKGMVDIIEYLVTRRNFVRPNIFTDLYLVMFSEG